MQKFKVFVITVSVTGETAVNKRTLLRTKLKIFVRMNLALEDYLLTYSINT